MHFEVEEKKLLARGKDRRLSEARAMAGWLALEWEAGTLG